MFTRISSVVAMNANGYDPRSVVNAMIAIGNRIGVSLPNVSIQKLLYFAHAAYLVQFKRPLVQGVFEAWDYGPVCPPVYHALKENGRGPVKEPIKRLNPFTGEVSDVDPLNDDEALFHLERVLRTMGHLSPGQLIELSHSPEGAWATVWNKSKTGPTIGNRIDDILTSSRFSRLKMSLRDASAYGETDEATPFAGD